MTSTDGFTYSQPTATSSERVELNNEQIHALLNKLSSDEQRELSETMRSCTTEVTMTRGLPLTGVILGSLYFARTRLPAQYHFGPKGWPFYAIMGIASLTTSNLLFMGTCRDRIKPRIDELWKKYDLAKSTTNYDEIRRQNRSGDVANNAPIVRDLAPEQQEKKPYDYTYNMPTSQQEMSSYGDSFTSYKPLIGETSEFSTSPNPTRRRPPPMSSFSDADNSAFISGTPSGPPTSSNDKNSGYTFS
uniref:OCIA domain-containing protein n=1 Tax=Caenorhabditis japonica TaxID=281687 RepID=A0A8R1DGY9_CAEJA